MSGDTIFALSSGRGASGVAVIRISGLATAGAVRALAGGELPAPRKAALRTLCDPTSGEALDTGLVLWFPAPASFTGEDMAELQVHGSAAVIAALIEALAGCAGLRPAEPGEFSRRAFENGKLDLVEAEGLGDLIAAETDAQRRQAHRQMSGALSRIYEDWRTVLLEALAMAAAEIDFADEELPEGLLAAERARLETLGVSMRDQLSAGERAVRLRAGVEIAIVGPPNAGKSSLMNALAARDIAIVSEIPGTTRDFLETRIVLAGVPVTLVDTAGLRVAGDAIEQAGVERAEQKARDADIRLFLSAADVEARVTGVEAGDRDLKVWSKSDLGLPRGSQDLAISVRNGEGIEALLAALAERVEAVAGLSEAPVMSSLRQRAEIGAALESLDKAVRLIGEKGEIALISEELRLSARALERLIGRVDVEDMLDVVFGRFCIGK